MLAETATIEKVYTFNRTIVELKFFNHALKRDITNTFNRTIVELKSVRDSFKGNS